MDEVIYMRFSRFYAFLRMHVSLIVAYDREISFVTMPIAIIAIAINLYWKA